MKKNINDRGLIIHFKKHPGEYIEEIMIKDPEYIHWLEKKEKIDKFQDIYNHINQCIEIFDNKPFIDKCYGKLNGNPCNQQATRISFIPESTNPHFWCDNCDNRSQLLDLADDLIYVKTYREAVQFVKCYCSDRKYEYQNIISVMLKAKGFKGDLSVKNILSFFYD